MAMANHTTAQPDSAFTNAADWDLADQLVNTSLEVGLIFGIAICFVAYSIHSEKQAGKVSVGGKASKRSFSYPSWILGDPLEAIKAAAGNPGKVLKLWRCSADHVRFTDVCHIVVQAYLDSEPMHLVSEMVVHLRRHNIVSAGGVRLLETVAEARDLDVLDELISTLGPRVPMTLRAAEAIITAFATEGDEDRLDSFIETARVEHGVRMMPRHYVAALRGMLQAARPEQAMKYAKEMIADGYKLNPRQLTEIYQSFTKHGRAPQGIQCGLPEIIPTPQAILFMMESAARYNDMEFATFLEDVSRQLNIKVHKKTREAYVQLLVANRDPKALQIFSQMLLLDAKPPSSPAFRKELYEIAADNGCQDICFLLAPDGAADDAVASRSPDVCKGAQQI